MDRHAVTEPPFLDRYRDVFRHDVDRRDADRSRAVRRARFRDHRARSTDRPHDHDRRCRRAAGEILLEDSFEALLKVAHNTSAVTVHGVTRDQSRGGLDEQDALQRFLDYLRDGVIVGHHIGHDVGTFDAGFERHWGFPR